jgi:hypothetical protein
MKLKDLVVEIEKKSHITNFLTPHELIVLEAAILAEQMKHVTIDEYGTITLNEGFKDAFTDTMGKVYGLADKVLQGSGLIAQLAKGLASLKEIGTALYTYIKSGHTPADIEAFKSVWDQIKPDAKTIYEFLLNLDMVTLHAVTGPLHLLYAITGIDMEKIIEHKLAKVGLSTDKSLGLLGNLYTLAQQIKDKVKANISGEEQQRVLAAVDNLAASLPGPTPVGFS